MFIVVEVAGGEINISKHETFEDARSTMKEYFDEAGEAYGDEYFCDYEAYKIDANHANYDWKIFEV